MPNKNYPFHYEVRFQFFSTEENNDENLKKHSFTKRFEGKHPLESREEAFDECNEYLSFLEENGKLEVDKRGNFWIAQLDSVMDFSHLEKLAELEDIEFELSQLVLDNVEKYEQKISVFLVIDDRKAIKGLENDDNFDKDEFEIHGISSFSIDEQDIIDNLDSVEVALYKYCGIDIEDQLKTVYHFGEDFGESDYDIESGAKRVILKTPHIWKPFSKEDLK